MPLSPDTRELMSFLQKNPSIRNQIAAPPNATVLYAGNFIRPIWKELEALKRSNPEFAQKKMLPDVLASIRVTHPKYHTLLDWVKALDSLNPWKENGFIAWRAVSGIFASNAVGVVSFCIGSGISKDKVFAITELPVLLRNNKIDPMTRDILEYYERCTKNKQSAVNFGFVGG